ncbi:MAG: anion permease [Chloroflexota bacterium]
MPESLPLVVIVILFALGFGVANGVNDAANAIATVVGTRVLSPRAAITMAAVLNMAGALTGTAVALTITKGIIVYEEITLGTVLAAEVAAVIWTLIATFIGMPISVSHSLVSGLVGAGLATGGGQIIIWEGFTKVFSAVVCAPVLGFLGGLVIMTALFWIFMRSTPTRVRNISSNLQIISAGFLSYSHGKNDGQMPMGLIFLALILYRPEVWGEASIPLWVIVISALCISAGTAFGGWRVIKTVGLKITALRPVHGFAASFSAATVVEVASHLGIPVSTTHCMSSSVMGVGATRRLSAVRWGVARSIVLAWILTIPACCLLGWLIGMLF